MKIKKFEFAGKEISIILSDMSVFDLTALMEQFSELGKMECFDDDECIVIGKDSDKPTPPKPKPKKPDKKDEPPIHKEENVIKLDKLCDFIRDRSKNSEPFTFDELTKARFAFDSVDLWEQLLENNSDIRKTLGEALGNLKVSIVPHGNRRAMMIEIQ